MPIFPLVQHSVLFLVDGEIDGNNQLEGMLYPFVEFPWHTKPGVTVWSVAMALEQWNVYERMQLRLSPLIDKQLTDYFHKTSDAWWVCATPVRTKPPAIEGKYVSAHIPPTPEPSERYVQFSERTRDGYLYFSEIRDTPPPQVREEIVPQTLRRTGPLPQAPPEDFTHTSGYPEIPE